MPPLALDCPLCCKETFHSKDTLKHHLLETIDNLRCRLCNAGCSDILELVEHLEKNCGKDLVQVKCENTNSMEDYEDVCEMVDDQGEEIVDHQGAETAESKNTEAEESNDNDPNGLYSCLMCNMNFSSIEKHLEKYHEGEEVLLETDDVDEEQVQEVENTGDESEEYEETFIDEVEEPKRPFSQKRTKELSLNRGSTVKTVVGANVTDDDADIDDGGTYPPRNPIVEKYLFSNGEVRLLDDNEFEAIKDRSLVSEILRCPGCTLKFPNLAHYHKHKCVKKNVSAMLKPKPKKPAVVSENLRQGIKEGKYTCTFCQMRYPSLKALKMHMKIHLVEDESGNIVPNTVTLSLHQCDICNTKFPTLKSLRLHSKMHKPVPEKEVEPPVDYNIMGETEVNEEGDAMNVKHEMFQCQECFKEFDVKYKEAHLQSHNDESEYDCSICNKKFHSQSNLEMHMKAHSDVKKFSCSYCKKPFNTYEALENHTKTDCLQKSYECQYCGRRFSKPHEKVKHERIHTGEKPHVCQVCGKSFRVSFCLTLHMRTHTGSRPYMCNQCGKRFKSNGVYVHHLKTHSDVRNYKCPYCAKAFKTSVQLSSHKNSHTKPFSCTECNRPFASLYAVRAHMATHKKENNLKYDCWLCGATYARSFALKDHMNSVHMDYSITGETQNGEAVTIHGEPEEVEYEQVEEDEERMQCEENEVTEIVTEEITNVEMVES